MSLFMTLAADILVAILLVATIGTSIGLSRRIARLKADESALRQTIGDLVVASATAERAIAGLRATLDECDRTLAERLGTAERYSADLAAHVQAGEGVITRIGAIVAGMKPAAPREPAVDARLPAATVAAAARPGNTERLGAALAAARALADRADERLRAKAA